MNRFFVCALLLCVTRCLSQPALDVQHYHFTLQVNDENDTIRGTTVLKVRFRQPVNMFSLDLTQQKAGGKGMLVEEVTGGDVKSARQENDKIWIVLNGTADTTRDYRVQVTYKGIPDDGLIIARNKFGDRTFFADNWPNRAHHWIPCNDRPDDKATFEFTVEAPDIYEVISNGRKVEETAMDNRYKRTHWAEDVALSSKVMVVGIARFAIKEYSDNPNPVPVSAWVFPQDSAAGFYDYGLAPRILAFFSSYIAPYPYNKLANVQSRTIFGGMENASSIFYAEESVTGNRKWEEVIAHEIAHQWFGDMASEKSFAHLWLSEGFATYFTDLYYEKQYGIDKATERLRKEREQVIQFAASNHHAVVDSTANLMSLLNANSYQKGGWVLHMLRKQVGDSAFHRIIQAYYSAYKGGNAQTSDLEKIASDIYGQDLGWFFHQWLSEPGIPRLNVQWHYMSDKVVLNVEQASDFSYRFPLTIGWRLPDGKLETKMVEVNKQAASFTWATGAKPSIIILDPYTELLFSGTIKERK